MNEIKKSPTFISCDYLSSVFIYHDFLHLFFVRSLMYWIMLIKEKDNMIQLQIYLHRVIERLRDVAKIVET